MLVDGPSAQVLLLENFELHAGGAEEGLGMRLVHVCACLFHYYSVLNISHFTWRLSFL